jgi:hypothetical protein
MMTRSLVGNGFLVCFTMTCAFVAASGAFPQEESRASPSITVGSRIRLLAPAVVTGRIEGMVIQLDGKSLLVGGEDRTPVSVSREAITQLEVSTGRHRQTLKGMCIGAGIGALLGFATGCVPMVGCDERNRGGAALIYALPGALYGAGIGALIKRDRWSAVPLDRLRVTLVPTRGRGLGLSLSMSF